MIEHVAPAAIRLSVVIPTFRRPGPLARCLEGHARQIRPPDEILVVVRADDSATHDVLRAAPVHVRPVEVAVAGLLAAMQAGASAATGDVIAFFDDDAVPRPDWADRLQDCFAADPTVGAVGGRDVIPAFAGAGETTDVGRITRWGKVVANHHLAAGPARPVDVLKGVNMAFRRPALALPRELRGRGAQVHSEIPMSAWARNHGWRVVFDPAIVVDHMPAPRPTGDHRGRPAARDVRDATFNLVFGLVSAYPQLAPRRAAYGLFAGDRGVPGLLRVAIAAAQRDREVLRVAPASLLGQLAALAAFARGQRQSMVPVGDAPAPGPDGSVSRP